MNDDWQRIDIEREIVSHSKKIRWDTDKRCYDAGLISNLLKEWYRLARYYETHDDVVISIEVVREYIDWVDKLAGVLKYDSASKQCRDQVDDSLAELKLHMEDIIKATNKKLDPEN